MIVLEPASYRYPGASSWALPPASLELRPGDVLGVRGANERGNTTLCLVAAGLAPVTIGGRLRGRVLVDGQPTVELAAHQLAQRCGVLFDDPAVQLTGLHGTVYEEVAFGPCNLGLAEAEVHERTRSALRLLDLEHLSGRNPAHLFGGETQLIALAGLREVHERHPYDLGYSRRKLVAIAAVLAMRTPVVVLDEPTTGQDRAGVDRLAAVMGHLRAEGSTLLVVSHDPAFVRRVRMAAGRIAYRAAGS